MALTLALNMEDDIYSANLLPGMDAYAGYVGGHWPDFAAIAARFPNAHLLSIAPQASMDADCLDVENYDATPEEAPGWFLRQEARGVWRPVIYCSVSIVRTVIGIMAANGIGRDQFRLWTAHYAGYIHICSPACYPGMPTVADGTQWVDRGPYDESTLEADFFSVSPTPQPPAPPIPQPIPEGPMLQRPIIAVVLRPQNDGYWMVGQDGGIFSFGNAPVFKDPLPPADLQPGELITDAKGTATGLGLILAGSDGGVFAFGDAKFCGSVPGLKVGPSTQPLSA